MKVILAITFLTSCGLVCNCMGMKKIDLNSIVLPESHQIQTITLPPSLSPCEDACDVRRIENEQNIYSFIIKSILPHAYTENDVIIKLPNTLVALMKYVENSFCEKARQHIRKANENINENLKIVTTDYTNSGYRNDGGLRLIFDEYGILHALYRHDPNVQKFAQNVNYNYNNTAKDVIVPHNQIDFGAYCQASNLIDECVKTIVRYDSPINVKNTDILIQQNATILKSVLGCMYLCQKYQQDRPSTDKIHENKYLFTEENGSFRFAYSVYENRNISLSTIFRKCEFNDKRLATKCNTHINFQFSIDSYKNYDLPDLHIEYLKRILSLKIDQELRKQVYLDALTKKIKMTPRISITQNNMRHKKVKHVEKFTLGKKTYYYILDSNTNNVIQTEDGVLHDEQAKVAKVNQHNQRAINFYGTEMAARYDAPLNIFLNTLYIEMRRWTGDKKPHFQVPQNIFSDLLLILSQKLCIKENIGEVSSIDMSAFKINDTPLKCVITTDGITGQCATACTGLAEGICRISIPNSILPIQGNVFNDDETDDEGEWQTVGKKK